MTRSLGWAPPFDSGPTEPSSIHQNFFVRNNHGNPKFRLPTKLAAPSPHSRPGFTKKNATVLRSLRLHDKQPLEAFLRTSFGQSHATA